MKVKIWEEKKKKYAYLSLLLVKQIKIDFNTIILPAVHLLITCLIRINVHGDFLAEVLAGMLVNCTDMKEGHEKE
jgi:hypothetical protein